MTTRRFYFGEPRPHLFGAITYPAAGIVASDAGVVICAPIGHEESSAYRPLRGLAHQLAQDGHTTLRFDLPGVGDSLGDDGDEGLLEAWLTSIGSAVEALRARADVTTVALVGVRLSATLAALAAARGAAVDEIVLWEPLVKGRAYVREMRAFNALAQREETESTIARDPLPEGAVEASGFLLNPTTVDDLSSLDLMTLEFAVSSPRRILLGTRTATGERDPLATHLRAQGIDVECAALAGLEDVVGALPYGRLPTGFDQILAWLRRGNQVASTSLPTAEVVEPESELELTHAAGAVERILRIDDRRNTFGVAALPPEPTDPATTWVVFVGTGNDRGTGANRLWVDFARSWARRGVPSLRIGSGEGDAGNTETLEAMYDPIAIRDTANALAHLRESCGARRFVIVGMCAGGYAGLHTALVEPDVIGVALVNPVTLLWNTDDPGELAQYASLDPFRRDRLWKLLSGKLRRQHVQRAWIRARSVATTWLSTHVHRVARRETTPGSELLDLLDRLLTRGCRLGFVFSRSSDGLDYLKWKLGPRLGGLPSHPGVDFEIVDGPDHTFRALWSHDVLRELLELQLESCGAELAPVQVHS